jgi:uncharacterized protein (TIGR03435 family)
MKRALFYLIFASFLVSPSLSQTPNPAPEFEVVSIKPAPAVSPYHSSEISTGGPGTADPGTFHCTCTVAALIMKAFELQRYQFPGEAALPSGTYDVSAKIPHGTTQAQFLLMLQNMLKERYGLTWHFDEKEMQGYQLTVAKSGPKLKESDEVQPSPSPAGHTGWTAGGDHNGGAHTGLINFGGKARYRGDGKTMAELAVLVSNQIAKPVSDETGLKGKYDILLNWSTDAAPHIHQGGDGYGDHRAPAANSSAPDDAGPTIFEALQSQLGLKLVATKRSTVRIFLVDHVEKVPTAN